MRGRLRWVTHGLSDPATAYIQRMGNRRNSILLKFLLWCALVPNLTSQLKNLVKVPSDVRVPGRYFVHVRHTASATEMQALVEELQVLDTNNSMPNFHAKVLFTITNVGRGFSANLSDEALHYVS